MTADFTTEQQRTGRTDPHWIERSRGIKHTRLCQSDAICCDAVEKGVVLFGRARDNLRWGALVAVSLALPLVLWPRFTRYIDLAPLPTEGVATLGLVLALGALVAWARMARRARWLPGVHTVALLAM